MYPTDCSTDAQQCWEELGSLQWHKQTYQVVLRWLLELLLSMTGGAVLLSDHPFQHTPERTPILPVVFRPSLFTQTCMFSGPLSLALVATLVELGLHVQAGDPVAFFVGRNPEAVDGFVASVLKAGFGTGGDDVTINILSKLWQVKVLPAWALYSSRHLQPFCRPDNVSWQYAGHVRACITCQHSC